MSNFHWPILFVHFFSFRYYTHFNFIAHIFFRCFYCCFIYSSLSFFSGQCLCVIVSVCLFYFLFSFAVLCQKNFCTGQCKMFMWIWNQFIAHILYDTHYLRSHIYNNKIYYVSINIMRSRQEAQLSDDEHDRKWMVWKDQQKRHIHT